MGFRAIVLSAFVTSLSIIALAQSGTTMEQDACRPDVRKFCHELKTDAGPNAFQQCLLAHREKLTKACRNVLENHGV
jgi:hypothetical protein